MFSTLPRARCEHRAYLAPCMYPPGYRDILFQISIPRRPQSASAVHLGAFCSQQGSLELLVPDVVPAGRSASFRTRAHCAAVSGATSNDAVWDAHLVWRFVVERFHGLCGRVGPPGSGPTPCAAQGLGQRRIKPIIDLSHQVYAPPRGRSNHLFTVIPSSPSALLLSPAFLSITGRS